MREPRSTLRRVSLLGAAALLRPACRAGDSIYQHKWHMQHSASLRTSDIVGARQGCTGQTKPPVQQRSSAIPDRIGTCWVLITAVPVHKVEVCPQHNRMTKLNGPDKSSTEGCKGSISCSPAFTKVITRLIARHHQKLFLQWCPSTTHPQIAHTSSFGHGHKRENAGLGCWKQCKGQLQHKFSSLWKARFTYSVPWVPCSLVDFWTQVFYSHLLNTSFEEPKYNRFGREKWGHTVFPRQMLGVSSSRQLVLIFTLHW